MFNHTWWFSHGHATCMRPVLLFSTWWFFSLYKMAGGTELRLGAGVEIVSFSWSHYSFVVVYFLKLFQQILTFRALLVLNKSCWNLTGLWTIRGWGLSPPFIYRLEAPLAEALACQISLPKATRSFHSFQHQYWCLRWKRSNCAHFHKSIHVIAETRQAV